MELNIVFGSVKKANASRSAASEFNYPSIKLEANRGPKTSRRILFNRQAATLLSLENGAVQEILFGFAEPEEGGSPRLFLVNTEDFQNEVEQKTYKTSKNETSFTGSSEKGKGISSTPLSSEIRGFLGLDDDSVDVNFRIETFSTEGEATVFELIVCEGESCDKDTCANESSEYAEGTNEAEVEETIQTDPQISHADELLDREEGINALSVQAERPEPVESNFSTLQ